MLLRLARHPFLLGFACAAIGAGVTIWVMAMKFPSFAGWPGSAGFARIAGHLAREGLYSSDGRTPTLERMPLYPAILAAAMRLGGAHWRALAIAWNAAAFAAAAGLAAQLCARLNARPGAVWVCALLLGGHIALDVEAVAFRETAWFTLAVAGMASALTAPKLGSRRLVLAGACAGGTYLLRPTGFLLILALPIWLWFARRTLLRSWGRSAALGLAVALVPVAGWQVYALRDFGRPVLADTEGGNTALKGALPAYWTLTARADYDLLDPILVSRAVSRAGPQNPLQRDAYWRRQTLEAVRADPAGWVLKGLCKAALLFCPATTPLGSGRLVESHGSIRLADYHLDPWSLAAAPVTLLILAGAAFRCLRRHAVSPDGHAFSAGVGVLLVLLIAVHAATLSETRYRLPFDPLLAVLSAPAIADFVRRRLTSGAAASRS